MKGKEKDKKTGLPDFLKYRGNNLTGSEKNSFERELQKDLFASEAGEGFSLIDPSILRKDMEDLENRLRSRTSRVKSYMWYRVAASFAVLMVITTLFLVVQNKRPGNIALETEKSKVVLDIVKPEAIQDNVPLKAIAQNQEIPKKEKSQIITAKEDQALAASGVKKSDIGAADTAEVMADEIISAAAEPVKQEPLQMKAAAPAAARAVEKSRNLQMIRGKVISSEDDLPIPGAIISIRGTTIATTTDNGGNFELPIPEKGTPDLIASFIGMKTKELDIAGDSIVSITMDPDLTSLDEVVVTGYGIRRSYEVTGAANQIKGGVNEEAAYSYIEAEPIGGKDSFNKYVVNNIKKPDQQDTRREVVVLSFTVKLNGRPSGIKILRSPGKQFSDEAIRLVMEGPQWKPATENGVNIEDEVRVRIVFK